MRSLTLSLSVLLSLAACDPAPSSSRAGAASDSTSAVDRDDAGTNCDLSVEAPSTARAGEPTHATVTLRANGPWKVNQDAPMKVEIRSSDVELHKTKLGLDDSSMLAEREVRMEVPFTPHAEGPNAIEVHARYGVCDDLNCDICREKRGAETLVN